MTWAGRVLVVGDAMVDVIGAVTDRSAAEVCSAGHVHAALRSSPGGSGVVAALAARAYGAAEVGLWTSVGDDPAAAAIRQLLSREGVVDLLGVVPACSTGTVVCLELRGERMLVADPGANAVVSATDPDAALIAFARRCDVLYVSGYALQFPARAALVMRLIDLVHGGGGVVALDLVPHRIETVALDLDRVLRRADVIIGEEVTVRRVYTDASDFGPGVETELFAKRVAARHELALIRVSNDDELLASADGRLRWSDTGYRSVPPDRRTGFLDRRAVEVVLRWREHGR